MNTTEKDTLEQFLLSGGKLIAEKQANGKYCAFTQFETGSGLGNPFALLIDGPCHEGQEIGAMDGYVVWQYFHPNNWVDCTCNNPVYATRSEKPIRAIFRLHPKQEEPVKPLPGFNIGSQKAGGNIIHFHGDYVKSTETVEDAATDHLQLQSDLRDQIYVRPYNIEKIEAAAVRLCDAVYAREMGESHQIPKEGKTAEEILGKYLYHGGPLWSAALKAMEEYKNQK